MAIKYDFEGGRIVEVPGEASPVKQQAPQGTTFKGEVPLDVRNFGAAGPKARCSLPDSSDERNAIPMADGLLYYFPNALAEVARVSLIGSAQHNVGQPMHWARGKSKDHANKILRHLVDAGRKDNKGVRHSAYLAWRALALLQIELEEQTGVPPPRNAY